MCLQCTGEVVGVGAAEAVAAAGGSSLLTVSAAQSQTSSQSQLHIDQGAGLSLVHLTGPQSTVQVDLRQRQMDYSLRLLVQTRAQFT